MGDELQFINFSDYDPFLREFSPTGAAGGLSSQARYLHAYLLHLGVKSCILEKSYPDWDWMAQHDCFYNQGMQPPSKSCKRLHFFSMELTSEWFEIALSGNLGKEHRKELRENYLGFIVKRPIYESLGRTILKLHPILDTHLDRHRVIRTVKKNEVHIASLTLHVVGIAWHQKDKTGGCSTVALWTALQGSPYRDFAFSSTPEITRDALSEGSNPSMKNSVFPNAHLTLKNLQTAIKTHRGLRPLTIEGDIGKTSSEGFSLDSFKQNAAVYLAAGFPIVLFGIVVENQKLHAVCLVGFTEGRVEAKNAEGIPVVFVSQETGMGHVYLNDDVIGPMVKFKIVANGDLGPEKVRVELVYETPGEIPPGELCCTPRMLELKHTRFVPTRMLVALPSEIRVSSPELIQRSQDIGIAVSMWVRHKAFKGENQGKNFDVIMGTRLVSQSGFFKEGLEKIYGTSEQKLLGRLRLELGCNLPAIPRFLGLVRVAIKETNSLNGESTPRPILDFIFDTTGDHAKCISVIKFHPYLSDSVIEFMTKHAQDIISFVHNNKIFFGTITFTDNPADLCDFGVPISGFSCEPEDSG